MRKFFTFDGTGEKVVFVQKFENDDSALADAIHLSRVSQVSVCEILPDGEIKVAHSCDDEPSSEAAAEPWDGEDRFADGDALASAGFGMDEDHGGCNDW
jgi:hypothetical protein